MEKNLPWKYYWMIVLCLATAVIIYPFPSTGFLYRNADELKGRGSCLKAASVVLFLDPSFYYKFKISPLDVWYAVSVLGLTEESKTAQYDYYVKVIRRSPLLWNTW
jgi:hypothetical protein